MGELLKRGATQVEATYMNLLDHPLDIQSGSVTAGRHGSLAEMAHGMIERHWVTILTLLIVGVTLAASMHFPVFLGPLHGHPGR